MNKKSILLIGILSTLLLAISTSFLSCDKSKPWEEGDLIFYITNPFDYDVFIAGNVDGCDKDISEDETPECYLHPNEEKMFKPNSVEGAFIATSADWKYGFVSDRWDYKRGTYKWTVGENNPFVKVDDNSGSGSGSKCPGTTAQHYKDLMDENPMSSCQQIWAQQAAWYAYKCECDNGLGNASDAQQMVAVLNSIRDNIVNLYETNGGSSNTTCGSVPPQVSQCKIK